MKIKLAMLPAVTIAIALSMPLAQAREKELNLYTARHYQVDEALYADFTRQTGIKVNRIEMREDELLERIRTEGALSPADVFITVDAARLAKADQLGLFAPLRSKVVEARIPAPLRSPNWSAFSTRARVIIYNKATINPADVQSYEDLTGPKMKNQVCSRSGSHPYNLSLLASLIAHHGEQKAEAWARGVLANFARPPKGGDTDQIRAVAAGECGVAISNSYYLTRLMRSDRPADKKVVESVGVIWPNQRSQGVHMNISGGGILKNAPNKNSALKFVEYLVSDSAQHHFANGNNEWPAAAGVKVDNPALAALGEFKADPLPIPALAKNAALAQKIFDRVGWR